MDIIPNNFYHPAGQIPDRADILYTPPPLNDTRPAVESALIRNPLHDAPHVSLSDGFFTNRAGPNKKNELIKLSTADLHEIHVQLKHGTPTQMVDYLRRADMGYTVDRAQISDALRP